MEETHEESSSTGWRSDDEEKPQLKSVNSEAQIASQTLWATGKLVEPIPEGFYFITPERRFKDHFDTIPSLDELYSLESEGLKPNVIIVDTQKDKKLAMLKQLSLSLVKGLSSNPSAMIKKIAGLVCDIYKRSNKEGKPIKSSLEEVSNALDNQGIHLLGQIKRGSCRSRAILFKVLADAAGLDSRLTVGLRKEGAIERADSYKHMSVTVVLDSVELLVDLTSCPGKLVSCSMKAILLSHVASLSEIEYMENESYGSPLDSSSSVSGFPDQVDFESVDYAESYQSYQHKLEASMNVSGRSLRSIILQAKAATNEEKLNLSHSEPNVADSFWHRGQKKVVVEQGTTISSPEHPFYRRLGRSILGDQRFFFKEFNDDINSSRSAGASPIESRRRNRRSVSMIPEIGDDIVSVVRAMNLSLKQSRATKEQGNTSNSGSTSDKDDSSDIQEYVPEVHTEYHDGINGAKGPAYHLRMKQAKSQKAISLPSSPQHFMRNNVIGGGPEIFGGPHTISTLNKVIKSSKILNKPLLPFHEWNIDYSEISVGTRVGIGFFGEVFRGTWNGIEVAVKLFLEQDSSVENIEDFCNEISILSRIRHPNVILFLGACTKPPHLSIVTEYMDMGSLYYLIHVSGQKKRLSWRRKLKMLCSICRGLMCIHRMNIAHRDVKSANCLVNKHWTVKICDFGLSRFLTTRPMKDCSSAGTPEWMAPELIRNEPFTEKCDIFSLGVIIWELCTLTRPWEGVPSTQVVYAVANDGKRLEIPEGPLGELIADCWAEPDDRPSCQEVLARLIDCEFMLC